MIFRPLKVHQTDCNIPSRLWNRLQQQCLVFDNRIEEFKQIFRLQEGFRDLDTVAEITSKEELEVMGINLLGSKLKLMSKIRAFKTPSVDR